MAPKVKSSDKKANAADKAAALAVQAQAEQKKKDQMNLINQLKQAAAKDSQCDKAKILEMYQNEKKGPFKSEILQKWLQDKSCKWANEYLQVRTEATQKTDDTFVGHGTVCLMLI